MMLEAKYPLRMPVSSTRITSVLVSSFFVVYIIREAVHDAEVHLLNVADGQIEMLPLKVVNFYAPHPARLDVLPFICAAPGLLPSNNLDVSETFHDALKSLLGKYCGVHLTR